MVDIIWKKKIYTERTLQFHRIFLIQVEQKIVYNQNQIKHTNMSTRFFFSGQQQWQLSRGYIWFQLDIYVNNQFYVVISL